MEVLNTELSTALIVALSLFLREAIGWFFSYRKKNQENKGLEIKNESSELDNIDKAVVIWRQLATDLQGRVEQLSKNQTQVLLQHDTIIAQNKELKNKVGEYEKSIGRLTKHITALETKVTKLTNENKELLTRMNNRQ